MTDLSTGLGDRLPERVERHGVLVRRWELDDAPALHAEVGASLQHLRPFMGWVVHEPQALDERCALVQRWTAEWRGGGDLNAGVWHGGVLVGSASLTRRPGPGALEVGYWTAAAHVGRGFATAAARALTDAAFTVPGVERVVICHDVANAASSRVPAKLGYERLADRPSTTPPAPARSGVDAVWHVTRSAWTAGSGTG